MKKKKEESGEEEILEFLQIVDVFKDVFTRFIYTILFTGKNSASIIK